MGERLRRCLRFWLWLRLWRLSRNASLLLLRLLNWLRRGNSCCRWGGRGSFGDFFHYVVVSLRQVAIEHAICVEAAECAQRENAAEKNVFCEGRHPGFVADGWTRN